MGLGSPIRLSPPRPHVVPHGPTFALTPWAYVGQDGPMPTDRETAKVYFTKVEMSEVKAAAGYEAVSGFIRRAVLEKIRSGTVQATRAGRYAEDSEVTPGSSGSVPSPKVLEPDDEVREPEDLPRARDLPPLEREPAPPLFASGTAAQHASQRSVSTLRVDRHVEPASRHRSTRTGNLRALKAKVDKARKTRCPHGFMTVDGVTACPHCK